MRCIFTGVEVQPLNNDSDQIQYYVNLNNKDHFIKILNDSDRWVRDNQFFIENQHLFFGLIYNDNWFENENQIITIDNLKLLIENRVFPTSPEDKLEILFIELFSLQKEDGEMVDFQVHTHNFRYYYEILWRKLFFKSFDEYNFYINVLHKKQLIAADFGTTKGDWGLVQKYRVTFEGLNYFVKLSKEGNKSKKCFIAMSFKPEAKEIGEAIKMAIRNTGFDPILMSEINIDSDKTINDEIIAYIKRSKFVIADFTFHSMGVYFEAAFALGLGKQVIYTCRKDEYERVHFDIKPLQHLLYESTDELVKLITNRIEAWIK